MTAVLTDERIAAVLRPFVRATSPVLDVLRESDPLRLRGRFGSVIAESGDAAETTGRGPGGDADEGTAVADPAVADEHREPRSGAEQPEGPARRLLRRLDGMRLPGSSTWDSMSVAERCDWWAQRVGRLVAVVAGLPRFGGAVTSRLPIRNALGLAGQGLVLSAIAGEHGATGTSTRVRLIAKVLLDREIPPEVAAEAAAGEDAETAELTEGLDSSGAAGGSRPKALVRTVWRMARALWEIDSELDKRPQGRAHHQLIGNVPVIGVVGGYLGERSALRRVAELGAEWLQDEGFAVPRR